MYRRINMNEVLRRYKPRKLLVIEDLQLSSLRSIKRLRDKVVKISTRKPLLEYLRGFITKRKAWIDLLSLVNNGFIDEEDDGILEYLFLVDEKTGTVDKRLVKTGFRVKVEKEEIKRDTV